MNQAKISKDYSPASSAPVILEAGDKVTITDKATSYAGWVWCVGPDGKEGWVPETYLDRSGGEGVANQAYSGDELAVSAGDEVRALYDEAGWYWCLNGEGESGWVPGDHLEITG